MAMSQGYDLAPVESQDTRWERLRQRVMVLDRFPEQEPAIADELVRVGMQRVREKAEFARMMIDGYRGRLVPLSRMMDTVDAAVLDMASTSHQCGLDGIPEMDQAIGAACGSVHLAHTYDGYLDTHLDELGKSFNDVARSVDAVSRDSIEACSERVLTAMREAPDQKSMQIVVRSCIERMTDGGQMGPGLGLRESMGMPRDEGDAWRSALMVERRMDDAKAWFGGARHNLFVDGFKWDMHAINDLVEDARRSVTDEFGDVHRFGIGIGDIAGRFAVGTIRENYDGVVDTLVRRRSLDDYVSSSAAERRRYLAGLNETLLNARRRSGGGMSLAGIDLMRRIEDASFDLPYNRDAQIMPVDDAEAAGTIRVLSRSMQRDCEVTGTRSWLSDERSNLEHAVEMVDSMGEGGAVAAIMYLANQWRSNAIDYAGDTRVGELVRDAFVQGRDVSEITSALEAIDDIGKRTPNNLEEVLYHLDGLSREGFVSPRVSRDMPGRRMPSPSLMPLETPDWLREPELPSTRRMPSQSVMPTETWDLPWGPEGDWA